MRKSVWLLIFNLTWAAGCASSLNRAAADGDRARLAELIASGEDVNAPDGNGWTPLHFAVFRRQGEAAILLLDRGADVKIRDNLGRSPLDLAAQYNLPDMVELLISHGADPRAADPFGGTPLHYAATKGNTAVIEVLLARGADVNAREHIGWTPLDLAVDAGKKEAAELLRDRGGEARSYAAVQFLQARSARPVTPIAESKSVAGDPSVTYDSFSEQTALESVFSVESLLPPSQRDLYREAVTQKAENPEDFYRSAREAWLIGPFREVRLASDPRTFPSARLSLAIESGTFFFFEKAPAQVKIADTIFEAPLLSATSSVGDDTVRTQGVFLIGRDLAAALVSAPAATLRIVFADRPPLTWTVPPAVLQSWQEHFQRGEKIFRGPPVRGPAE
ncbi:MAG: ankyrin repeat domain-containing protein [Candidatus Aureabacteria bacterium]|nr:ankyrin repeat domain-containing protein [Candidatus Auribacterota bacterium]